MRYTAWITGLGLRARTETHEPYTSHTQLNFPHCEPRESPGRLVVGSVTLSSVSSVQYRWRLTHSNGNELWRRIQAHDLPLPGLRVRLVCNAINEGGVFCIHGPAHCCRQTSISVDNIPARARQEVNKYTSGTASGWTEMEPLLKCCSMDGSELLMHFLRSF